MAYKITDDLARTMLDAFKSEMDLGFCYIFTGAVPATPDLALDMGATHTQVAMLSVDDDGVTGLAFSAPAGAVVAKNGDVWEGTIAFDGFEDGETTLTPTFFRFCAAGDNGRGAASTPRLQGTVGGPSSTADLRLASDDVTANGTNTIAAAMFNFRLSGLG